MEEWTSRMQQKPCRWRSRCHLILRGRDRGGAADFWRRVGIVVLVSSPSEVGLLLVWPVASSGGRSGGCKAGLNLEDEYLILLLRCGRMPTGDRVGWYWLVRNKYVDSRAAYSRSSGRTAMYVMGSFVRRKAAPKVKIRGGIRIRW